MGGADHSMGDSNRRNSGGLWAWFVRRGSPSHDTLRDGIRSRFRDRPRFLRGKDIRSRFEVVVSSIFRPILLAALGTGLAFLILAGFQLAYYQFVPMNWWIQYSGIAVIGHGPDAILYVTRRVKTKEPIPIRVYAELHNNAHGDAQVHDQWCEASNMVMAEPDTGPIVKLPIRDVLRGNCGFNSIPCQLVHLQIVVEATLPMSVLKRKRFLSGPFYASTKCVSRLH